jgi:hypothetical protein
MAKGREAPYELLDVLDIPDLVDFKDGLDLFGVHLDATLGDDVP